MWLIKPVKKVNEIKFGTEFLRVCEGCCAGITPISMIKQIKAIAALLKI